jgi:hypothetical protein
MVHIPATAHRLLNDLSLEFGSSLSLIGGLPGTAHELPPGEICDKKTDQKERCSMDIGRVERTC